MRLATPQRRRSTDGSNDSSSRNSSRVSKKSIRTRVPDEVYAARLDHVSIDLTAAGFKIDVEYIDETAADRLTRLYEELSR